MAHLQVLYKTWVAVKMCVVIVGPAEVAAAAPPSGAMEGMLSRKHEWESTTKKSSARSVLQSELFMCNRQILWQQHYAMMCAFVFWHIYVSISVSLISKMLSLLGGKFISAADRGYIDVICLSIAQRMGEDVRCADSRLAAVLQRREAC